MAIKIFNVVIILIIVIICILIYMSYRDRENFILLANKTRDEYISERAPNLKDVSARDVGHFKTGAPNLIKNRKVIINPANVGFSANSMINRNVYADIYNNIGARRLNPVFKSFSKFGQAGLGEARYAVPEYPFSTV